MKNLKAYSNTKENNFKLIRLGAAVGVFISHTFPLAGYGLGGKAQMLGHVSLNIFFIISGFLVCKSLFERPMKHYLLSRVLRIWPALIASIFLSVFILGTLMTDYSVSSYLRDKDVYKYFFFNIALIIPNIPNTLPGLFIDNNYSAVVNSPLWSLPYELMCYLLLALLAVITQAKNQTKLFVISSLVICIVSYCVYIVNMVLKPNEFSMFFNRDFYRLTSMFFIGVSMFLLSEKIIISHKLMVTLIGLFCISLIYRPSSITFFYLVCAYALFYFAYIPKGVILKFNSLGDYSYGIYILGYPIQQTVEHLAPNLSLLPYFCLTFCVTLLLAIFSWHLIEKKALLLKP